MTQLFVPNDSRGVALVINAVPLTYHRADISGGEMAEKTNLKPESLLSDVGKFAVPTTGAGRDIHQKQTVNSSPPTQ